MKHNSGQTLIEVIVAAGLVVLVLTTLVSGLAIGIRNNRVAKDSAIAKEYVQSGLEWFRNTRDQAGWETFVSLTGTSGTYCLTTLPTSYKLFSSVPTGACGANSYVKDVSGNNTIFKRKLEVSRSGSPVDTITAVGTVTWVDGLKSYTSTSTLTLYKLN